MEQPADRVVETVTFTTDDGHSLTGDLAIPAGAPALAAVVCHPHPGYGGDRFNTVVEACWRRLAADGVAALRFDFRADFGGGVGERRDVVAALDLLAERWPGTRLVAVGYSFGAMVVLGVADPRLAAIALVAPPLSAMPVDVRPGVPTLVLTPVGDQFTPPDAARPIVDGWRGTNEAVLFETVAMADHFLVGRADQVAERVAAHLTEQVS